MIDDIKYLIIPDVHGRSFWKDSVYDVLKNREDVKVIFLGDYLDPYDYEGISVEESVANFEEIIDLKKKYTDRVILLLGNHDLHYVLNYRRGVRMIYEYKSDIVAMFRDNFELFECIYTDKINDKNIIFSHAGFPKGWLNYHMDMFRDDWLDKYTDEEIWENIDFEFIKSIDWKGRLKNLEGSYIFSEVSYHRGGQDTYSSFMWADVHEMIMNEDDDLINAIQVFGHSQQREYPVNYKNTLYCLDCRKPFVMTTSGEIKYIDGSKLDENGTSMKEEYEKRLNSLSKYAGIFI